ncbi:hypothetical protein [Subtercola sp. YIM 133946]|uniref:hypothetical protein n=1 Tax=Subtercola sp. YIM 133946 TaxID=3118909 RepID=UPI002F92E6FB
MSRTHVAVVAALIIVAIAVSAGVAYLLSGHLLKPNAATGPSSSSLAAPAPSAAAGSGPGTATPTTAALPPSVSPPLPAVDAADPGTWMIGFDGVGPAKLGSALGEQPGELQGIEQTGGYGEAFPYFGATDGSGGWIVFGIVDDEVDTIQVANEAALPIENRSVKTLPAERCPA